MLYSLQNLRPEPFSAESLRLTATNGVVFAARRRRASADPLRVFDQMKIAAKRMAHDTGRRARRRQPPPARRRCACRHPRAGRAPRRTRCAPCTSSRAAPRALALFSAELMPAARSRPAVPRIGYPPHRRVARGDRAGITRRYYVLDAPTISDAEYDALFRELQALEARAPVAASRRIRRRSASAARRWRSSRRCGIAVPMLSIRTETDTTAEGAAQFDARVRRDLGLDDQAPPVEYAAELKFDGLAISLRYENGRLVRRRRAATARPARTSRANVRTIRAIPLRLRRRRARGARGARRGLMTRQRLRRAQRSAQESAGEQDVRQPAQCRGRRRAPARPGASPRSGRCDSSPMASGEVEGWALPAHARASCSTRSQRFGLAGRSATGAVARAPKGCSSSTATSASSATELPFDIDGVVYKVNRLALQQRARASSRARRAGRSRTSFRRRKMTTRSSTSTSRSAAPAR